MPTKEITYKEVWDKLSKIDCSDKIEKKMNLSYLSWAWAWGVLMEEYPQASYLYYQGEGDVPYVKFPDGTEIKVGGMDTDQIADIARENGAPGLKFKNIIDIGHDINIQPDTRNLPLELVQSKEYQEKYMEPLQNYYDAGGADQYAIFDTSRIRSINAKADPAQKESSEILATIAPMAVGTGAAYMVRPSRSQDEET